MTRPLITLDQFESALEQPPATPNTPLFSLVAVAHPDVLDEIASRAMDVYDNLLHNGFPYTDAVEASSDDQPDSPVIVKIEPRLGGNIKAIFEDTEAISVTGKNYAPFHRLPGLLRFTSCIHTVPIIGGDRVTKVTKSGEVRSHTRTLVPKGTMYREDRLLGYGADYVADILVGLNRARNIQRMNTSVQTAA